MKKWYAYIILLASVLFASCNIEDTLFPEQECDTKTEPVNVRLILSMMGGEGMSRALTDTPTGEAHPEAELSLGNEYYINPYDVEVLVFTCGDTPEISKFVERASMVRASETNYYYQYQLDGTLTKIQEGTAYRMVVLANMNGSCYTTGSIPLEEGSTTMKEYLESLVYTGYSASFTAGLLTNGSTERIPMWGTTAAYLNDGAQINMDLLRAMAKVKVKMPKNLGKELSAVTLEYANPSGYVTPLIANRDENTATNANGVSAINNDAEKKTITGGNTQRVRTPRIPKGLTLIDSFDLAAESTLSFSDVSSTDNYEYVIYIPEYKNLGSEATPARMKLAIGDKSYKLEFKDYSEDNTGYFDIIRNYYYSYEITSIGKTLAYTADIKPWGNAEKIVEIIVEDFHWLYVKDKVLYMNNDNQIKTTFDSSTDDLVYTISDVKVYNTSTAWSDTNGKINSVTIDNSLKGDITINSDIPDNFVGKEFKVTVSSATSGKSETIQVYQFPPLYIDAILGKPLSGGSNGQNNPNMYVFKSLLADYTSLPDPDEFDEEKTIIGNNHPHERVDQEVGLSYAKYIRENSVMGYPLVDSNDGSTINSTENNRIISPSFILASQHGTNTNGIYKTKKDFCANYTETSNDGKVYSNWRMPTLSELYLIDVLQNVRKCAVKAILEGPYYWSSYQTKAVKFMDSRTGNNSYNEQSAAVRCVHDIK